MELREWMALVSAIGTIIIVPFGGAFWTMQKRLSRIEGVLEVILKKVR